MDYLMIKVIDNFLTKSYHKELLGIMTSDHFSWYFNQNISKNQKNVISRLDEYGFTHIFWDENGMRDTKTSILWKPGLYQIMDAVNLNFILRSRGDMTMYSHKEFVHDPHVDYYFKNISAVYYVNNSDGDTIFYNQRQFNKNEPMPKKLEITNKVSPKANRLVFFDGNIIHTGMSPNKHKNRIIINSNFKL
jgi:hypothetical protein